MDERCPCERCSCGVMGDWKDTYEDLLQRERADDGAGLEREGVVLGVERALEVRIVRQGLAVKGVVGCKGECVYIVVEHMSACERHLSCA